MVKIVTILCMMFMLCGCETFDFRGLIAASSSVEKRFDDARDDAFIGFYPQKIVCPDENYRFVVATDLHLRDNQFDILTHYLEKVWEENNLLSVFLGDYLYTAGASLQPMYDVVKAQSIPCFMTIGNHDVYKDGYWQTYRGLFGPTAYSFVVSTPSEADLFVVIDSANGTLARKQTSWLTSLLEQQRRYYRHCFVFTHANFFLPGGGIDLVSTYSTDEFMKLLDLFSRNHVTAVFTGHSHKHDVTTLRGVSYITINPLLNHDHSEYIQVEATKTCSWNFYSL